MRIRFLAAAVLTAGALMATLTGAANASGAPDPTSLDKPVGIVCEGAGGESIATPLDPSKLAEDVKVFSTGPEGRLENLPEGAESIKAVPATKAAEGTQPSVDVVLSCADESQKAEKAEKE